MIFKNLLALSAPIFLKKLENNMRYEVAAKNQSYNIGAN
jgi:hypothetical protein